MKENGLHKRNSFEFVNCKVVIEYVKLQRVWFGADDLIHGFLPKNRTEFEFEKYLTTHSEFFPDGYNYLLTYESENGTEQVFLKLNWFKEFKLNWITGKNLLRSKEVKIAIIIFLITNILSFIGGGVYQKIKTESNRQTKAESVIKDEIKTENKSLEPK